MTATVLINQIQTILLEGCPTQNERATFDAVVSQLKNEILSKEGKETLLDILCIETTAKSQDNEVIIRSGLQQIITLYPHTLPDFLQIVSTLSQAPSSLLIAMSKISFMGDNDTTKTGWQLLVSNDINALLALLDVVLKNTRAYIAVIPALLEIPMIEQNIAIMDKIRLLLGGYYYDVIPYLPAGWTIIEELPDFIVNAVSYFIKHELSIQHLLQRRNQLIGDMNKLHQAVLLAGYDDISFTQPKKNRQQPNPGNSTHSVYFKKNINEELHQRNDYLTTKLTGITEYIINNKHEETEYVGRILRAFLTLLVPENQHQPAYKKEEIRTVLERFIKNAGSGRQVQILKVLQQVKQVCESPIQIEKNLMNTNPWLWVFGKKIILQRLVTLAQPINDLKALSVEILEQYSHARTQKRHSSALSVRYPG